MEIIPFLRQFQQDLLKDRAEQHANPSAPIYYGILDFKTMPAPVGESDRIIVFDTNRQESTPLEEYFQNWDDDEKQRLYAHEDAGIEQNEDGSYVLDDPMQYARYLDENEDLWSDGEMLLYEYDLDFIEQNAMFFTKADAEAYLSDNSQHYTENARVVAMLAIRYPRYEQLLQLFADLDLTRSRLYFRNHDDSESKPIGIDWENSQITHTSEVNIHDI